MPCPIAQSLEVVGDWWTLLIVRDALFFDVSRFDEFRDHLGIPTNVLTNRLQMLVDHGVLARLDNPRGRSTHEYRPTPKGQDLWPVIAALVEWGNRWNDYDETIPLRLTHERCGTKLQSSDCPTCRRRVGLSDVTLSTRPRRGRRGKRPNFPGRTVTTLRGWSAERATRE